jgi:hypothetical protein
VIRAPIEHFLAVLPFFELSSSSALPARFQGLGIRKASIDHAPKDHSNRRKNLPDYAALEIHPLMKIEFSD